MLHRHQNIQFTIKEGVIQLQVLARRWKSLEIPIRNQESRTPGAKNPFENEESRTLNVGVIYASAMGGQLQDNYRFPYSEVMLLFQYNLKNDNFKK